MLSSLSSFLVDLPSPSSLSYSWNFGSLLGMYLFFQILTGTFLAIHFVADVNLSFSSVVHIMRDINAGWIIRVFHSNGAGIFFLFLYLHIGRGMYYGSYRFFSTWMTGVTIFLLSMATAFLGYVLPWGQMSFWAATVITNLLSAIPYVGVMLVEWVWGGFAVGNPTLTRFFSFHFILPFVVLFVVILHLVYLHETGSGNPLGLSSDVDSVMFHPFYVVKDVVGMILSLTILMMIGFLFPYLFMDSENFIPSNPLVTPTHIQPEWYFLFAYTILRSIPSKIGGVVGLTMSVMVLYMIPFIMTQKFKVMKFYVAGRFTFWMLLVSWLVLTWIGAREVEYPYVGVGEVASFMYFFTFVLMKIVFYVQDKMVD